ncbi:MAG: glycosyltransferase [Verrucomicrobia bacterium]|nr:glycosyltransferase [Verrucomicrobiota bacterium]
MKTALIHDWLVSPFGGGERYLQVVHEIYPSPIYTLLKSDEGLKGSYFANKEIISSFIQKLPRAEKKYRNYLPLFPLAIEQFDLGAYDLILSSSHCVAKGALTHHEQLHICYCHTPIRYAWDLMNQYLEESNLDKGIKGFLARAVLHYIRNWDVRSANSVDTFIANSKFIAQRIQKIYRRDAKVIYPPVETDSFPLFSKKEGYYLTASRMVPYKRMDLIVEAFSAMPDKRLIVIGSGPDEKKIREKAKSNIEFLGFQDDSVLRHYLQRAKGFVYAALEDFGILPVEAMACGTPVIAYGRGGLTETVSKNISGVFFEEQSVASILRAIDDFEGREFNSFQVRAQAEKFSRERFVSEFRTFVENQYSLFKNGAINENSDFSRRGRNSSMAAV